MWGLGWVGKCLVSLGGKWWGMMAGGSPADECGLSSALVLFLYIPYPFCPCISHTHRTNCLPSFPYPLFPTITTHAPTAWCWELLFYVAPSGWLLISPLKCFSPVCCSVSGQASGLVRSMTCVAFPWLWQLVTLEYRCVPGSCWGGAEGCYCSQTPESWRPSGGQLKKLPYSCCDSPFWNGSFCP